MLRTALFWTLIVVLFGGWLLALWKAGVIRDSLDDLRVRLTGRQPKAGGRACDWSGARRVPVTQSRADLAEDRAAIDAMWAALEQRRQAG